MAKIISFKTNFKNVAFYFHIKLKGMHSCCISSLSLCFRGWGWRV